MPAAASRPLTERQRAVMERIDRRVPIKMIAQELGVSETRINQHIRALKNIYDADSLGALVERFREDNRAAGIGVSGEESEEKEGLEPELQPFSEPEYKKSQLPADSLIEDKAVGDDPGRLVMNDVLSLEDQAPWLRPGEPRVVPRVLDGENAVWFRLAAMLGIAFGVLAAVVLTLTAAVTISEALEGRAVVPVDENGFS